MILLLYEDEYGVHIFRQSILEGICSVELVCSYETHLANHGNYLVMLLGIPTPQAESALAWSLALCYIHNL